MNRPKIFIGSSTEGLKVALAVHQNLQFFAEVTVWNQGIFELSTPIITTLLKQLDIYDFAIFVFSPDDITKLRGETLSTVRDNVVFETGLFISKLGMDKVYFLKPWNKFNVHLPSDLLGVISGEYDANRSDDNLQAATSPFCIQVQTKIQSLMSIQGNAKDLPGHDPAKTVEEKQLGEFRKSLHVAEDVGDVLHNKVLPIIRERAFKEKYIKIENFGLDLETVMPWLKNKIIHSREFDNAIIDIKSLIINPQSIYLKDLIDGESNISSDIISATVITAKRLANYTDLNKFSIQMKEYDLPPIMHGFMINDEDVFLGFTEIENGKLIGGINPYIHFRKSSDKLTEMEFHYYKTFRSWFDYYWSKSNEVAYVKK